MRGADRSPSTSRPAGFAGRAAASPRRPAAPRPPPSLTSSQLVQSGERRRAGRSRGRQRRRPQGPRSSPARRLARSALASILEHERLADEYRHQDDQGQRAIGERGGILEALESVSATVSEKPARPVRYMPYWDCGSTAAPTREGVGQAAADSADCGVWLHLFQNATIYPCRAWGPPHCAGAVGFRRSTSTTRRAATCAGTACIVTTYRTSRSTGACAGTRYPTRAPPHT